MFVFLYSLSMIMVVCMSETAEDCKDGQIVGQEERHKRIDNSTDSQLVEVLLESRNISREFCIRKCCHTDGCDVLSFNQEAENNENNCFLYSCIPLGSDHCKFVKATGFISYSITTYPEDQISTKTTSTPSDTEIIQKEVDQNEGVVSDKVVEVIYDPDTANMETTTSTTISQPTHETKKTKTSHSSPTSLKQKLKTVDKSTINLATKPASTIHHTFSSHVIVSTSKLHKSTVTGASPASNSPQSKSLVKTHSSKTVTKSSSAPLSGKGATPETTSTGNSPKSPLKNVSTKTAGSLPSSKKPTTLKSLSKTTLKPMTKSVQKNANQSTSDSDEAKTAPVAQSATKGTTEVNQTEIHSDDSEGSSNPDKSRPSIHSSRKSSSLSITTATTTTSTETQEEPNKSTIKSETNESSKITTTTAKTPQNITKASNVLQPTSEKLTTQPTTTKTATKQKTGQTVLVASPTTTTEATSKITTTATKVKNASTATKSNTTAETTKVKTVTETTKAKTNATKVENVIDSSASSALTNTTDTSVTKAREDTGEIITLKNDSIQTLDPDIVYKSEVEQDVIVVTPSSESADLIIPTVNNITLNDTSDNSTQHIQIVKTGESSEILLPPEITVINNTIYFGDSNVTYADSNQLLKEKKESHVLSGALIATLSFGILFFFAVLVLIGKRCFDSWQRRHYSRVDYLVNGMYN